MKIFRAFFLAVLLLALAPAFAGAAEPAGGSSASHEGVEAAKAGDWNKAIEAFKRAGDDANNRYNLALAYRQRGLVETKQQNWDAAIADFNEALKLKADDNVVRRFRAAAYMSKQDWPKALEDYDAVLKAKRTDTEALERRSFVEMQLKQYDKSIADYTEAIKQQPKNVDALLGRSYVYEQQHKLDQGLADCEAVLRIQPTNSEATNRKKRLIAEKTKGQPIPEKTPILIGTPIPRQPTPPPKPKPAATPAPAASASPQ